MGAQVTHGKVRFEGAHRGVILVNNWGLARRLCETRVEF